MSTIEQQQYNQIQIRIIRQYHSHVHPELDRQTAAMLWINKYASIFHSWWINTLTTNSSVPKA